ncbi:MAG: winged helix-turn-helix transcriptional regulator [Actinobacteria bacterium]|nr:winged helix-turn-helix transcriptional regulator [Actinomycetota bacterium]
MSEPRWLDEAETGAWRGYRRMRARLDLQISRDLARDAGLSNADYDVLSNLSETEGHRLRLNDLAAEMLWSSSRLSHHLTRMQKRGLVTRDDDPSDARGAVIVLTKSGWKEIRRAAPLHVESVRRNFIDLLSRSQIETLGDVTGVVVRHLNDQQNE